MASSVLKDRASSALVLAVERTVAERLLPIVEDIYPSAMVRTRKGTVTMPLPGSAGFYTQATYVASDGWLAASSPPSPFPVNGYFAPQDSTALSPRVCPAPFLSSIRTEDGGSVEGDVPQRSLTLQTPPTWWDLDATVLIHGFSESDMQQSRAALEDKLLERLPYAVAPAMFAGMKPDPGFTEVRQLETLRKRHRRYLDWRGLKGSGLFGASQMVVTLPEPAGADELPDLIPEDTHLRPCVTLRVGFGDPTLSMAVLNAKRTEEERIPLRPRFGASLEVLKERLPEVVVMATRAILAVMRRGFDPSKCAPPMFWLNAVTRVAFLESHAVESEQASHLRLAAATLTAVHASCRAAAARGPPVSGDDAGWLAASDMDWITRNIFLEDSESFVELNSVRSCAEALSGVRSVEKLIRALA